MRALVGIHCASCEKLLEKDGRGPEKLFCDGKCGDDWSNRSSPHPYIPRINPRDFFYCDEAREEQTFREAYIQASKADPFNHGWVPDHWKIADDVWGSCSEMLISGGNRSGKTIYAAREAVRQLLMGPERNVICCHTSNGTSVTIQQPAIYHYLPAAMRATKKGKIAYLNYSRKNGFTDGSFILPNGSRCDLLNYTQSANQIEGREADFVWCDELVPQEWIESLRFRLVSRRGKLLITQTPLEGVASVYEEFTAGGKVTRWDDADMLPGRAAFPGWPVGKVPRVMDCRNSNRKAIWFFTGDNGFSPYDEIKSKLQGAPTGQILVRVYGWATDNIGKAFSRFRPDVHCISRRDIPSGGTPYMVIDPAGARNWFGLWALAYPDGKWVITHEFPDFPSYGEWALPGSKSDGKPGPAQTNGAGRGIGEYLDIFREIEADQGRGEPLMRLIDPKAGSTPQMSKDGGVSLIDLLADGADGSTGEQFSPAPGVPPDQRMAAINSALSWDSNRPISYGNQPKLYIVDDLENTIWCLSEHTGRDGQKGASKDPIDCLGYLLTSNLEYIEPGGMQATRTSGGY